MTTPHKNKQKLEPVAGCDLTPLHLWEKNSQIQVEIIFEAKGTDTLKSHLAQLQYYDNLLYKFSNQHKIT